MAFPGMPDFGAIGKAAEEATKRSEAYYKESLEVLREIRDAVRDLVNQLKGE